MFLRLSFFLHLIFTFDLHAQTIQNGAEYISPEDQALTIRTVTVLPMVDNLGGIYARPLEAHLIELVEKHHRWDYRPSNFVGAVPDLEDLEGNPGQIMKMNRATSADAIIMARAVRGPKGLSIRLNLFLGNDGRLLTQQILTNYSGYQIPQAKEQLTLLYAKLIKKIPYEGLILSRINNRVTLNLGLKDQIQKGQLLTAIQILKINRHPKFNFLVSTQKAILGQVKVLKVDSTLSFGVIVSEREKGALKKFTKLARDKETTYDTPEEFADVDSSRSNLDEKPENQVSFGKNPKEWKPESPPTFGIAGVELGLGFYTSNANLSSSGGISGDSGLFNPNIGLFGELWITPKWSMHVRLRQGIAKTDNPLSGSSPDELTHSLSHYAILAGYNLLLRDDFWGPKIQIAGGFSQYKDSVDDSSPTAQTSVSYSGLTLMLSGSMPVSKDKLWRAGLELNLLISPGLDESPVTSGSSSDNTVNDFRFIISRQWSEKMIIHTGLQFQQTRSTFSGTGSRSESASSQSQKLTQLLGGVSYLF